MGGTESKPNGVELMQEELKKNVIVVFSGTRCVWCHRLADLLQQRGLATVTHTVFLDRHPDGQHIAHALNITTGQRTIPNVFIGGVHVGGYSMVEHLANTGELDRMIAAKSRPPPQPSS
ncbi:Glutaredoxin-C2 [Diplonema papillatum]|nr:Glutaredoxin-C2 [Diplonema papillatum]